MNMTTNSFALETYKYLFFDIFHKNNKLFLICPVYVSRLNISDLHIYANDVELSLIKQHVRTDNERTEILIYSFQTDTHLNKIIVKYNDIIKDYELPHINNTIKNQLSVTTLFKNDYKLINLFYNYYLSQGVTNFYMYYNGKLTHDIIQTYNMPGITLIEWDFQYWFDSQLFIHHAQAGQMSHALHRYGREESEYMIFCDLDEYMYIPGKSLFKHIKEHPAIDMFGFCNRWCDTPDGKMPEKIPNTIRMSDPCNFPDRAKCIYRTDAIELVSIHGHTCTLTKTLCTYMLLHFHRWSGKVRESHNHGAIHTCVLDLV